MSGIDNAVATADYRSQEQGLREERPVNDAWYAIYTCSRREKQVARMLGEKEVECFLPLRIVFRAPKRGRKIQLPLFPGYMFVHIALRDRTSVLQVPGVSRLLTFQGKPAAIPEAEITALQRLQDERFTAEPYPYLKINSEVTILNGPFQGLRGRVIRKNNRSRIVLSVDLLHRSVAIDMDQFDVEGSPAVAISRSKH